MSHFRPAIEILSAYEPGEQPASGTKVVKLNTNENPYPPSPRAVKALEDIEPNVLRLYPRPFADEFREAAASVLGIDPSWVLVGNGSDDLLTMLLRSISGVEQPVAYPVPTYILYRTLAQIQGAQIIEVPFDEQYDLPVDKLVSADAALTLIASPNSPSGNRAHNDVLSALASKVRGILVIDEAYVEFASGNALDLTQQFNNVVVLRTLSKSHSMAGLRLGFAVAPPPIITNLSKVKDSYNIDAIAAHIGAVAIKDITHMRENVDRVCESRDRLAKSLAAIGFRVWPSEANFLLVRPPDGKATETYTALKAQGILVRHFNEPGLDDKLRITIGTDHENDRLIKALSALGAQL